MGRMPRSTPVLLALAVLIARPANAQSSVLSNGTVTDSSGAVIPQAKVLSLFVGHGFCPISGGLEIFPLVKTPRKMEVGNGVYFDENTCIYRPSAGSQLD